MQRREGNVKTQHRFEDVGFDVWSDVFISQGMLAATRSWKRQGMDFPLDPPKEV